VETQTLSADLIARVDALAQAALRQYGLAGLTVGVRQGQRVFTRGYGFANLAQQTPARADTPYPIASLTKQFTAAAIMQLVEQGKLHLDDSITQYVSGLPDALRAVTLHQLLNHTSGIPGYTNLNPDQMGINLTQPQPITEVVRALVALPLELQSAPGSTYAYSNVNYILLGVVIEKASGQSYADYIRQHVTQPAGLHDTYAAEYPPELAQGYMRASGGISPTQSIHPTILYAAAGMFSRAPNLLAWQQALSHGRVVSAASFQHMIKPGTRTYNPAIGYGYGLMVTQREQDMVIYHDGILNGFLAYLSYHPAQDTAIVLLTNTSLAEQDSPLGELENQIAGVVLQR
jgi:CubicO group peptidase (beta-lactamase class C family)